MITFPASDQMPCSVGTERLTINRSPRRTEDVYTGESVGSHSDHTGRGGAGLSVLFPEHVDIVGS